MNRLQPFETLIMLACCTALFAVEAEAAPVASDTKATRYLSQFGYLPPVDPGNEANVSEELMSAAISEFQSFAGIRVTGIMNAETAHMMSLPRCDVKDTDVPRNGGRSRRYVLQGSKWENRTSLTYKISKYSTRLDRVTVDRELARAFAVWSEYTDLTFALESGEVDIEVKFETGEHCSGRPFQGRDGALAHGFFPEFGGDIHFNDEKDWTFNSDEGSNFFEIAVHEIGHSLGLKHNDIEASVMNPYETPYNPNFKLDRDDIAGIQAIYGPKTMKKFPQICGNPHIETIISSVEGHIFVFKGKYYWRLTEGGIAAEDPKLIATTWRGLPDNIEYAFTHENGQTYFFKGLEYWSYLGNRMNEGYPRKYTDGVFGTAEDTIRLKETIQDNRRTSSLAMRIHCTFKSITNIS